MGWNHQLGKKNIFAIASLKFNSQQKHLKKRMGLEDEMTSISFWDGFMGSTNSSLEVLEFLDPQSLQIMAPKQITYQNYPHQKQEFI